MPRSQYEERKLDRNNKIVWIIDLDGGYSVTNDADKVCRELNERYPGYRIIYRDTMGNWDELEHKNGQFLGYRPARDMEPA